MAFKVLKPRLRFVYRFGVILKGLDGLIETGVGLILFVVPPGTLRYWMDFLTSSELAEDPHDRLAHLLLGLTRSVTAVDARRFDAFYLLGHGLVKVFLSVALLRELRWAYPWAMVVLIIFVCLESYRLTYRYSPALAAFIFFDLLLILLVHLEYQRAKGG